MSTESALHIICHYPALNAQIDPIIDDMATYRTCKNCIIITKMDFKK